MANIDEIVSRRGRKPPPVETSGEEGEEESAPVKAEEAGEDDYGSVEGDALDALAGVLGVGKGDRAAFEEAMVDLIEACAKRTMGSKE